MGQPPNLAHEKLVELKDRYNSAEHVDDVFLATHRDMVAFAVHATNGCEDKLAALVQLAGMQVLVAAEEKLREPAKLKQFFDSYHGPACPVNALVTKDENGRPVMPWTREIRSAIQDGAKTQTIPVQESAKDEGSGVEFSLPGAGKLRIYGKAAGKGMVAVAVVVFLVYRTYQDYSFKKLVEDKLANVSQVQARNSGSATVQRTKIREDAQALMDEGDKSLQYEPSNEN